MTDATGLVQVQVRSKPFPITSWRNSDSRAKWEHEAMVPEVWWWETVEASEIEGAVRRAREWMRSNGVHDVTFLACREGAKEWIATPLQSVSSTERP